MALTAQVPPRRLEPTTPADCTLYHSMALPGIGDVAGIWDLRSTIDVYLGEQAFQEKRCLDVGTASGYLAFEMERRGAAEVIAVDVSGAKRLDFVPFATGSGSGYADVCRGRCLAAHPAELLGCASGAPVAGPGALRLDLRPAERPGAI